MAPGSEPNSSKHIFNVQSHLTRHIALIFSEIDLKKSETYRSDHVREISSLKVKTHISLTSYF